MRKGSDIGVQAMRSLVRHYHTSSEAMVSFQERAIWLVRLYFEEAFRRSLLEAETGMRKAAYCSMLVSMRGFEADSIADQPRHGFFLTFSEEFVRSLGTNMGAGEATSFEGLPSFVRVQASVDLRYEVNSLMEVRTVGSSIKMS